MGLDLIVDRRGVDYGDGGMEGDAWRGEEGGELATCDAAALALRAP